jgi:hypothetical protein
MGVAEAAPWRSIPGIEFRTPQKPGVILARNSPRIMIGPPLILITFRDLLCMRVVGFSVTAKHAN